MKNVFHVFLRMFTKFFGERPSKLAVSLCVALFAVTTAVAEEHITDVMVIGGDATTIRSIISNYGQKGWTFIDQDLNADAGGDYIYILYKKSSGENAGNGFITDFIIRTSDDHDFSFNGRTYIRANSIGSGDFVTSHGNLNSGTTESSSTKMWLYYTKEEFPDRRVVSDIAITTGLDKKIKIGYTTLGKNGAVVGSYGSGAMDLNEGAGSDSKYIFMHFATVSSSLNTTEFISDVVVLGGSEDEVKALKERYSSQGWVVVRQDLNAGSGSESDYIYMAYKRSPFSDVDKGFITDFFIKTGDHPDFFTFKGWTYYRVPSFGSKDFETSGGNLNSKTKEGCTNMWLYFTRESFPDKRVVSNIAFSTEKTKTGYTTLGKDGAVVSDGSGAMDLNDGAGGAYIYMHFATAPSYVNITFVTGLNNVSVPTQTVVSGLTPTKPSDPERTGLRFAGWFADESFTTEFDFSAPVTSNITVYAKWLNGKVTALSALTGNHVAENGELLMGKLGGNYKISIADGAAVTLDGVTINGVNNSAYKWAGITCEGNCKIILKGANTVKGFYRNYPGIYVPEGKTLIIEGDGLLDASSNGRGAGIGGGDGIDCGNILISGGTVTATGGSSAAGIGSGYFHASAGDITISGGTVAAMGGESAAGIGSGYLYASAGDITISGGTVTATGGKSAAGIGSGYLYASAGDITITDGVTLVTANKGESSPNSVGLGENGKSVGKISIGGVFVDGVSTSPFTYPANDLYTYTIAFDANGGEGTMSNQKMFLGFKGPLLDNVFARSNYAFMGWNTKADGSGTSYADGASVLNLANQAGGMVILYAQWLEGNVVNLKDITNDFVVQDGYLLKGTLGGNYKVSIADGATVTLDGVTINGVDNGAYKWAGLTCMGDCKIILKGENTVKGFYKNYPGIYVPEGKTLIIEGDGLLDASSNGYGAGIGGGYGINCGSIVINGGTVTATGGSDAAGIGSGYFATAGDITISGGTVTATGGDDAAGIGSGYGASAGDITISGGTVTATGGSGAAGIGSGYFAAAGDITITDGVTLVTASKGEYAPNSIGLGRGNGWESISVGSVSIGGVVGEGVPESPFIYPSSNFSAYTVVFNANDGEGNMPDQKHLRGLSSPLPANVFTREGYVFAGWNTAPDGSGASFADEASVSKVRDQVSASVVLYAQWVEGNVINLKALTQNFVVQDGYMLTGKLGGNYKISIADGATVTLYNVTINGVNNGAYKWAGLTCKGDCKIILKDENTVKGFHSNYPGIYVPEGKTLIIEGDGLLDASSNGMGAGIGGGYEIDCGNIVINGGMVTATGGESAAGIGSGVGASAGSITISGGTVIAMGGSDAAGIGSGVGASAGSITISGGTVTATGGSNAAGIGSGNLSSAGDITITDGVTLVTANKGENAPNSIGLGKYGKTVGSISIGGVFVDGISESPYTFQTYDVVFDANGGTGSMEKQHFVYDAEPIALAKNIFTCDGLVFAGWNTKDDGTGTAYADGAKVQNLTDEAGGKVTLYVQWNKITNTFAAITISKDKDEKLHATIDGDYCGTDAVSIDDENGIVVDKVELDRTLSTTGYATITLPFDIDSAKVKGAKQFLKFVGVILNEETKLREVHFERAWCDLPALLEDIDNLKDLSDEEKKEKKEKVSAKCNAVPKKLFAYTPYVVQMKDNSLTFDDGVTLVKTPAAVDTVVGNWKFKGTLAPKVWEEGDPEIGNAYGYVAGTGEFRKVGDNSSIGALRSYLVYEKQSSGTQSSANVPGMSNIRANFSTEFLPANMDVVIVDDDENGNEHRTVIGKFNTRTGEFKFLTPESGTFDVKGRRVNATRSVGKGRKAKGVYYGRNR